MIEKLHLGTIGGTALVYLFIIVGFRLLGKKELGQLSIMDLILVMLISEAVGTSMVNSNESFLGGILAATTLMLMNKLFKILQYKSKKFSLFMEGRPAVLIRHGKLNKYEMRKNKIDIEELEQAAREKGIGDISTIKLAILEVDGKISILDTPVKSVLRFDG